MTGGAGAGAPACHGLGPATAASAGPSSCGITGAFTGGATCDARGSKACVCQAQVGTSVAPRYATSAPRPSPRPAGAEAGRTATEGTVGARRAPGTAKLE